MKPVTLIVVGAGSRGTGYVKYAEQYPDKLKIVGVAEPRDWYRDKMAATYDIPAENIFTDWRELVAREKFADGVIIATQDAMHAEPAVAFANKGYNILLEKPMAPDEESCRRITRAVIENKIIFAVCHVLRYTPYTQKLKEIIDSGAIGEVVSVQHVEPVGYWHQAHSYVRGNWRNEAESSSMLLAKSCHDLDWLRYIMGCRCEKVSSFGSLYLFRKDQKPEDAGDRCMDCAIEPECPYSAKRIYLGRLAKGQTAWPVNVLTEDVTEQNVIKALQDGPYGRCVYECDNDVVDNQVVNMCFEGGKTASFTMTAFSEHTHRRTTIFGTKGEIYGDGANIEVFDFLTENKKLIETEKIDSGILGGHGGGDYGLMSRFVKALAENDPGIILSGPEETLETHLMVFAAEKARHEDEVVKIEVF
ncbi:MAG: Gfo/Idh/MocA family oxidoreductase [Phycisphaerae bacterium]|nr:Gfo/Idh/MocA family oxidoreductase [Phycisphaerae bacterium]